MDYKDYFRDHYKSSFNGEDIRKHGKWFHAVYRYIKRRIPVMLSEHSVLEIGSGLGGFYDILDGHRNYIGLELDKEAVRFSNDYFQTDCFLNKPIEEFVQSGYFDFIFAFEVLEHLENPLEALGTIHDLLKPNGCFCGTSPFPFTANIIGDKTHLYVLHPKNWERLFRYAGFSSVETYPMSFVPFLWRITKWANPILPVYLPTRYLVSTTLIIARA